jgi:alkanesulfonate monooxygenase SsuD/methylene tetrahydromethanopterin reductase-like flavin-dependent oxidoreductase (luciferase family)
MVLQIGVGLPTVSRGPDNAVVHDVRAAARRAEDLALESVWAPDHLIATAPILESTVALAVAAGATMPPVLIGGNGRAAIRRAVRFGDGWFPSAITPKALAAGVAELRSRAAETGRPAPTVTVGVPTAIGADGTVRDALVARLISGYGLPAEEAARVPVIGRARGGRGAGHVRRRRCRPGGAHGLRSRLETALRPGGGAALAPPRLTTEPEQRDRLGPHLHRSNQPLRSHLILLIAVGAGGAPVGRAGRGCRT